MTQGSGTEGSKSWTLLQDPAFMEWRETSQSRRVWRILYSNGVQNHDSHPRIKWTSFIQLMSQTLWPDQRALQKLARNNLPIRSMGRYKTGSCPIRP